MQTLHALGFQCARRFRERLRADFSGKRAGSGAKRGSSYAPTRRKQALLAAWQAQVALQFRSIIAVQLHTAVGASAVFAKDATGAWAHHPDPDAAMLARAQTGDEALCLTITPPNPTLLKQILDRLLGRAREGLAIEVPAMPVVNDAELVASVAALLRQWQPAR